MVPKCDQDNCEKFAMWAWVDRATTVVIEDVGDYNARFSGWVCDWCQAWMEENFPDQQDFFPRDKRKRSSDRPPLTIRDYNDG